MNILEEREQQRVPKNMLLHCGAEVIPRTELGAVETPRATRTWCPLAHEHVLNEVELSLLVAGFQVRNQTHALSHEGARYFGVLEIERAGVARDDYSWLVGVRNSHDKSVPAGVVAGTRVFVCDNLAFSGMFKIQRKHTRYAYRDLRPLINEAVESLNVHLTGMDRKIDQLKSLGIRETTVHDLVVRAVDMGAITCSQIPDVLSEWREPSHKEFTPRNAWSLFNSFTEVTKSLAPHMQVPRGEALQRLFDQRFSLPS